VRLRPRSTASVDAAEPRGAETVRDLPQVAAVIGGTETVRELPQAADGSCGALTVRDHPDLASVPGDGLSPVSLTFREFLGMRVVRSLPPSGA
jgi:hypothetical protein